MATDKKRTIISYCAPDSFSKADGRSAVEQIVRSKKSEKAKKQAGRGVSKKG
jgi:hypothetical protein